ncbi:glycosyltransferase [Luteolibacter yonseiensis]|uniref:Glycosyltransferase n=1 Tax=Luteolibacter yonseiensis TaxID=1144680 RepID=A0A934R674_9BACT|nr:glycosyltransferase family 4 protein [Luteolibacter yonseiensis]MBK1817127.1 glycosyltransferase [Luteolibacter yonseiensis]
MTHLKKEGHDVFLLYFQIQSFSKPKNLDALYEAWPDRVAHVEVSGNLKGKGPAITPRYALYRKILGLGHKLPRSLRPSFYSLSDVIGGADRWVPRRAGGKLREVVEAFKPEAVVCEYAVLSAFLDEFDSGVIKIIDTHDKFTDRNSNIGRQGILPWLSFTKSQERKALLRADHVIAIQQEEAAYFRGLTAGRSAVHLVEQLSELPVVSDASDSPGVFGLIGSPNPFNLEGLAWFYESIWPKITNAVPGAKMVLAGSICGRVPAPSGVVEIGFVKDRVDFYNQCSFVVNPVRGGTGLKIKSVEALFHARPLVTTKHGASGLLDLYPDGIMACDDPGAFAEACILLLKDQEKVRSMSRMASESARRVGDKSSASLEECLQPRKR